MNSRVLLSSFEPVRLYTARRSCSIRAVPMSLTLQEVFASSRFWLPSRCLSSFRCGLPVAPFRRETHGSRFANVERLAKQDWRRSSRDVAQPEERVLRVG